MVLKKATKVILLVIFTVVISCNSKDSHKETIEKEAIINNADAFLTQWHMAASEANFDGYFNKMDSISIFIGTDASENWNKKEFVGFSKPYFDRGKAWSFKAIDRNIYTNEDGSFIWFDELLSTWMGLCRGSGVLENKNNQLTLKHYVLSVTVPNDDIQKLIEIKKEKDSILEQSFIK
ncbi:nuclear transport factor 2 family protein [Pseudotenacibaculum sp. MALMAid0570]|uniref:nuclear transport factor 2 family protein n=1 Tax=Pseudotenacibaculum sp. MALMAid0570 TaxID=3143938 RepID=UPI0032DFB159